MKINDGNTNWYIGDEIGIAPTGWLASENEKRTITKIIKKSDGDQITFEKPL